ncbi:MAG: hypothetical protein WCO13_14755 [Bacteroidota bacterium]
MKKITILTIIFVTILFTNGYSQGGNTGSSNNPGIISLTPVIPDQVENIPNIAYDILKNKLQQIATINGLGGGMSNPRFIITANIAITTKDIIPGPPMQIAQNMELTFYIADYLDKKVFSNVIIELTGVGTNENKAYIDAFKNIKPANEKFKSFIISGKSKIIEYYIAQCNNIINNANSLSGMKRYDEAIYSLTIIPEACTECYTKAMNAMKPIYQAYLNQVCNQNIAKAKAAWAANQNSQGASDAGQYLSDIYPDASCYKEAQQLYKEIKGKVLDDWKFEMKKYNDAVDLESQIIQSYRDIGVAFGNHQQPVNYHVNWIVR